MTYPLADNVYSDDVTLEPTRAGYGRGLRAAGEANDKIVGLCADLTESTQMHLFREAFPDRYIQVGIAEQNLITVAAGLAQAGPAGLCRRFAARSLQWRYAHADRLQDAPADQSGRRDCSTSLPRQPAPARQARTATLSRYRQRGGCFRYT